MRNDFEDQLRPIWLDAHAGDEAAYRRALALIADRLRGYFARRMGGLSPDVEDLVQETLLALHLQQAAAIEALCTVGPELRLVHGGGKIATRPELDLDAFSDAPTLHRAMSVRDEGKGRWLVRTGDAYFFFAGTSPRCVKAGMKPIK